jgi:hypothetical protein
MSFNVSTSEVATYLTCKQRWMYAHHPSYNLEPRTLGIALTRGIVGHEALEIYYKAIFDGSTHESAVDKSIGFVMKRSLSELMTGDSEKSSMIGHLGKILKEYFEDHKWLMDEYNILGVENRVIAPLPGVSDIFFAGRIDLMLEVAKGVNKGEVIPWDHKFTYNFWSESSLKLNAQISNYVWAIRAMGMRSRKGIISMIRYRDTARDSTKQEEVVTTSVMRDNFIENHKVAAIQIVELKTRPTVGLKEGVTRSPSKFNCEYCPFVNLCHLEVTGRDSSTMIKASYRPNSYGYDNELDVA